MAKFEIQGIDEYALRLSELCDGKIYAAVVRAGASPVADIMRSEIEKLPEDKFRHLTENEAFKVMSSSQKNDLLDSLGIAPVKVDREGNTNTKIGFDGYGSFPTHKYPKGLPNALLARAVESGSSVRQKSPFVRRTVTKGKPRAIEAMGVTLEKEIKKRI